MSKRNGFTLVEVMMVTAILAVVGVVLVTVMANGVDIWNKVTGMASEEGIVVFFDKLTTDLDNTINQKDLKFQGDNRAVHIPSVVAAADGVIMPGMRTYFFNSAKSTIEKREEDYRRVTQNRVPGESAVIVENVESVRFSYYVYKGKALSYGWFKDWQGAVPAAVRAEVVMKGAAGAKYVKVIDIPVGKIEHAET